MKKIVVFCVILCLVCSSVFAFEGISKVFGMFSKKSSEEVATEEVNDSTPSFEEVSKNVEEPLTVEEVPVPVDRTAEIEGLKLTKKQKEVLNAYLDNIEKAAEEVIADSEKKDIQLNKTRYLATAGLSLGLDGTDFVVGATLTGGVKFRKGLMLTLGLEYDFFKTVKFEGEAPEDVKVITDGFGFKSIFNGYQNARVNLAIGWVF